MVFVPWQALGICKFHAMHKTTCHQGEHCRWSHPPDDVIRRLWDQYEVMETQGLLPQAEADSSQSLTAADDFQRAPLPPGHPALAPGNVKGLPPRPDFPMPRPEPWHQARESGDFQFRGAYERRESAYDALPPLLSPLGNPSCASDHLNSSSSRPQSRDHFDDAPRPFSQNDYARASPPPPQMYMPPQPPFSQMPPPGNDQYSREAEGRERGRKRNSDDMMAKDAVSEIKRKRGSDFDPLQSENPFVNGTQAYRFVWGNPLCVECGTLGHLPRDKKCEEKKLSKPEQDYLFKLVRKEQNRNKAEKGVGRRQPTSSLNPSLTPERDMQHPVPDMSSVLHALKEPRANMSGSWRYQGPLESQAGYWERSQARKPLRSVLRDHGESMPRSLEPAQTIQTPTKRKMGEESEENVNVSKKAKREVGTPANSPGKARSEFGDNLGIGTGEQVQQPPAAASLEEEREAVQHQHVSSPERPADRSATPAPALPPSPRSMGATKRLSNGEAKNVGPHPSTIRVSASYMTQSAIEKRLQPAGLDAQERSQAEAREDSVRLQGVAWLDNVRRALQLPIKTYTTACVYYHKFRLAHPTVEYSYTDAAAASLLTSCKNEDTLKKSRDILAAAYNLKQSSAHEQVGADDPIFEGSSRVVIGLERLVLESGGFDFRSRSPHHTLVKISKSLPKSDDLRKVSQLAWTILTDIHRTFAVLKQTSSTLALASLELAAHFVATSSPNNTCTVRDDLQALDLNTWHTTREEVMETLLDALDLYTHHTASSILGSKYSLDDLLRIRLALNKECTESSLPRYTTIQPPASPDNANGSSNTLRVANGHPTPVSPPQPGTQATQQSNGTGLNLPTPEGGVTLRFMLNPQRATEERAEVNRYYTEEWEEYEEEIEVPIPRNHSRDREHDRRRDFSLDRRPPPPGRGPPRDERFDDRRGLRDDRDGPPPPRLRGPPPEALRDSRDPERARYRDRERDRRYDDRRYDERERDRRYDDRRDRRYYEDDRRRGRDDRR